MDVLASFFSVYILLIILAAVLDVLANLFLAKSDGFRRRGIGILALILVGGAFVALSFAVRGLDLAVAYALWGSFGILGTSLGGWLLFGQRLKPCAWLGIALLLGGMVVLHAS